MGPVESSYLSFLGWLCHLAAVLSWISHLSSLDTHVLIYKRTLITVPVSQGFMKCSEFINVMYLAHSTGCRVSSKCEWYFFKLLL